MKTKFYTLSILALSSLVFFSCNSNDKKKKADDPIVTKEKTIEKKENNTNKKEDSGTKAPSERIDLVNKGVGPIKTITLQEPIDKALAEKGQEIFKNMCTACHKPTKRFIGPAPKGILERRTPEWVMNMILDPEGMLAKDPLAGELLKEFNGAPMANQNLTEEEARAVLEYFRTL